MATEERKYNKDDYTLKQWDRKIEEEEAAWNRLGISLNQMQYTGHDLFFVQCKLQSIINCIIEGDLSEETMNKWLKLIVFETMEEIRSAIEPQIKEAKLAALRGDVHVPEIIMPWDPRHPTNRKGNGG